MTIAITPGDPTIGPGDSTITLTIPGSVQNGDLLVACFGFYWLAGWESDQGTIPTNWTLQGYAQNPNSPTYSVSYVFTSIFATGDDTTPTWVANPANMEMSGQVYIITGASTTSIFDVAISGAIFSAPASPYNVTLSAFNTNTNGALAFFCWTSSDDNTWAYQSGGGGTEQCTINNTAGTDSSFNVVTKLIASAGTTGNQVSQQTTKGGDAGHNMWFAIKPLAAGPANLSKIDGLAKASISKVNNLAIGSVKSWDGLA